MRVEAHRSEAFYVPPRAERKAFNAVALWPPEPVQQTQQLHQAVFNALPMLIAVLDKRGQVLQANAACQNFALQHGFVRSPGSLVGAPYQAVLEQMLGAQSEMVQAAANGIAEVLSGARSSFQMEHCVATCNDTGHGTHNAVHWFTMQVAPVAGLQGQVVVSHQDISQIKAAELACRTMANVDELTGALSRRNFLSVAQQELQRALRYNMPLMVLMLDLDHFKRINDCHGHAAGDAVLQGFVQTVAAVLRTQDVMGRLGGEEFCVLLPNTAPDGGYALAQRIVETVDKSPVKVGLNGRACTVNYTVSIGACCLAGEHAFADLLHQADLALYRAKKGGRNQVVLQPQRAAD